MLALDVEIDGRKTVLAGADDWSILGLNIVANRDEPGSTGRSGYIECSVGGLTLPDAEQVRNHFRWPTQELSLGSIVTIRVVDAPEADAPKRRYRSDAKIQESPFTQEELRQMRYKDYMALKAEFEQNCDG
jgi:hypothetical protein